MSGNDVRVILVEAGYTAHEVAERLGISRQSLNSLFNTTEVKVSVLVRIARAINKSPYFFFDRYFKEDVFVRSNYTVAPLVSRFSYASYMEAYMDPDYLELLPMYITTQRTGSGRFMAFEVSSEALCDGTRRSICPGDVVLCREVLRAEWPFRIEAGRVYLFIHRELSVMPWEVASTDYDSWTMEVKGWNNDPDFLPRVISFKDLLQVFLIREVSRKFDL